MEEELIQYVKLGLPVYSPAYGNGVISKITKEHIHVKFEKRNNHVRFDLWGRLHYQGECLLFPEKGKEWELIKKFNPSTLKPFDPVLVRDYNYDKWNATYFSYYDVDRSFKYLCTGLEWRYCIPYNDDTKHLVGTTLVAPEFYK